MTTLAEIDKIVYERREKELDEELETIHQRLPDQYKEFADVFSKTASDTLPPPRNVDHQLDLEEDPSKTLGYSPLYEMSTEELEAAREYIINNLNKGFIVPSQSPYASPISVYYFFFLFVLFMLVTRDSMYAWMHNEAYPT